MPAATEPADQGQIKREDFLPLINHLRPRKSGSWVMFDCPCHDSGKGSRSAGISDKGYLGCFGGCKFIDLKTAIMGASRNGTAPRGTYGQRSQSAAPRPKGSDIPESAWMDVEAYEYTDAEGTPIAVKRRQEAADPQSEKGYEKRFQWRLPESKSYDGFHGKYTLADMPLWGADILAKDKRQRVWFGEGEKATKAIRAQGELAVCTGGGSGMREFGESLSTLKGRDVILWPDNCKDGRDYMREVAKALRGIARTCTIVAAPVGVKEDAHEYFYRDKGTIDALLENVLTDIQVDELSHDHFRVRIPVQNGEIDFEFNELRNVTRGRDSGLVCDMTVKVLIPGIEAEPYNQEINLKSLSTREGLRRMLEGQFGGKAEGFNWTTLQSTAYARVVAAWESTDRVLHLLDMPDIGIQRFLIERFLPWKAPTIFFGKGGSLKTYIVAWLILHLAIGEDLPTGDAVKQSNVMIIDFEDPAAWQERFRRLLRGMGYGGFDPDAFLRQLPIKFWAVERGQSLEAQKDALKRAIRRHEIDVLVVDSAMPACGGKPEDSDVSLAFFNTIHSFDITSLIISHVGHAEFDAGMRRPYGNVLWENQPRRLFAVVRDDDEDRDVIDVMLRNTKVNRGKKNPPIGLSFAFDPGEPDANGKVYDDGPVMVSVMADVKSVAAFAAKLSLQDQLRATLKRGKGPMTLGDMLDDLGLPDSRVGALRSALRRMPDVVNLDAGTAGGRGKKARYGLLAPGESPPEPAQKGLEGMPEAIDTKAAEKRRSHA